MNRQLEPRSDSDVYEVREANIDEFRASRAAWNRLVASMRYPTPFSTWEWMYTWWEHFGARSQMVMLFIYRGGELTAALPLYRVANNWSGRLGVAVLELVGVREVYPDHMDLIAPAAEAQACLDAAFRFLARAPGRWDVLRLPMIVEESATLAALRALAPAHVIGQRAVAIAPYIAGRRSFDEFFSGLSRNERHKLRSRGRKLLEGQGVEYVAYGFAERDQALTTLLRLHEQRAAEKRITSSFAREQVASFHRALLERLPWEQVLFRALRREREVIAIFYGFRVHKRVFYFQLGHDPAWSKWSPGLVLLTETIRESFGDGCLEYNFLQGDEPFKRIWAHTARRLYDCHVYNTTVRAGIARLLSGLKGRMENVPSTAPSVKIEIRPAPPGAGRKAEGRP